MDKSKKQAAANTNNNNANANTDEMNTTNAANAGKSAKNCK